MTTLCNNLTIDNYKTLVADRMFMTGYSVYSEGYEYEMDFVDTFAPLEAPHWIPAGSTKRSVGGSFILSSFWISLSYGRLS
jgi:hypothetical protein